MIRVHHVSLHLYSKPDKWTINRLKDLPRARLLTIIPSTSGMTMLNFPVAPCTFTLNRPVFRGWMKITGTSFSGVLDLKHIRINLKIKDIMLALSVAIFLKQEKNRTIQVYLFSLAQMFFIDLANVGLTFIFYFRQITTKNPWQILNLKNKASSTKVTP